MRQGATSREGLKVKKRDIILECKESEDRLIGVDGSEKKSGEIIRGLLAMEVRTDRRDE